MTGDGVRRYPNGANGQAPHDSLLTMEEVARLSRGAEDLRVLAKALPTAAARRDAAAALRAMDRLFAADRARRRLGWRP